MTKQTTLRFKLNISASDFRAYYEGIAQTVSVLAHTGQRLELAARHLQPYLLHDGIHGEFELVIDDHNRFVSLKKI